jgi:hypothetical protein
MTNHARLTPIDWDLLQRLRDFAASRSFDPAVLLDIIPLVQPVITSAERRVLDQAEATKAPFGAVLGIRLRSDPKTQAKPTADWLAQYAPNQLQNMLIELCLAAPTVRLPVSTDIFLAYYSPAYRWIFVCQTRREEATTPYDGPPSILTSLGSRLPPDPPALDILSTQDTVALSNSLSNLPDLLPAEGEVRQLYEFCDDFVADNFPLDELCQQSLSVLKNTYSQAAFQKLGMRVLS